MGLVTWRAAVMPRRPGEWLIERALFLCAAVSILVTAGIIVVALGLIIWQSTGGGGEH